jgi:hypothetical protein
MMNDVLPGAYLSGVESRTGASFGLLADALSELASERGMPVKAAVLKPRMRRLSMDTFDEKTLGYESFRAFLEEAARQGSIVLDAGSGQDYLVSPPSAAAVGNSLIGSSGASYVASLSQPRAANRRVRSDVWAAFVDWRQGIVRLYDRATGKIISFARRAEIDESAETAAEKRSWETHPDHFVQIEPISFDQQITWMKEFAEKIDRPELRAVLNAGFSSDRPAAIFRSVIRAQPKIDEAWRSTLSSHVIDYILAWSAAREVDIHPFEAPPELAPTAEPTGNLRHDGASQLTRLRSRLHSAIDAMPFHELMQIKIPVGYLPMD